jgi:hypothetical protein
MLSVSRPAQPLLACLAQPRRVVSRLDKPRYACRALPFAYHLNPPGLTIAVPNLACFAAPCLSNSRSDPTLPNPTWPAMPLLSTMSLELTQTHLSLPALPDPDQPNRNEARPAKPAVPALTTPAVPRPSVAAQERSSLSLTMPAVPRPESTLLTQPHHACRASPVRAAPPKPRDA